MQPDELLAKLTTNVEKLQSSCNYELEKQGGTIKTTAVGIRHTF